MPPSTTLSHAGGGRRSTPACHYFFCDSFGGRRPRRRRRQGSAPPAEDDSALALRLGRRVPAQRFTGALMLLRGILGGVDYFRAIRACFQLKTARRLPRFIIAARWPSAHGEYRRRRRFKAAARRRRRDRRAAFFHAQARSAAVDAQQSIFAPTSGAQARRKTSHGVGPMPARRAGAPTNVARIER